MKLLLFDIDGTLLMSGGAGRTAMNRAFYHLYGLENGFKDISMMGRTDPLILKDVMDKYGIPWQKEQILIFQEIYYQYLEEELNHSETEKQLCPGIAPLLQTLSEDTEFILGLLTGNWEQGAHLKLRHFHIEHFFKLGAYADDEPERVKMLPVAVRRYEQLFGQPISPENIFVIGDTPFDVQAARPHHVRTIAVATGFHTYESLKKESPDALFESFEDVNRVMVFFNTRSI